MITLTRLAANYQILAIAPFPADRPIAAAEIADLTLPPDLDLSREVILFGAVPMWLVGALVARCLAAPWIGCYAALEQRAIVICSRVAAFAPGDEVDITLNRQPGAAILIGGPPNSGKSVFSNALRRSLVKRGAAMQTYLHRANWDGEGNWSHQVSNRELLNRLIREYERRIHESPNAAQLLGPYFEYHGRATANLRALVDLVLVDVGGKTQSEKVPLLRSCTHYIVVSRDPALVAEWHDFCQPLLKPLAVIHSVREACLEVTQTEPWLELVAGPWEQGKTVQVPEVLLERVVSLVNGV